VHLGLTGVGVWSQLECARGRRLCEEEGCSKGARGSTGFCKAHGGGRRCQHEGCTTAATTGGTPHRKAHGGGCQEEGCTKSDQGGTGYCKAHGARQTLPGGGLYQV